MDNIFEIKWQADASLLSKMFILKGIEEKLNTLDIKQFQDEVIIKKIAILVQVFKGVSLSRRKVKAKFNGKRGFLEMTINIDYEELAPMDELDTYGLFSESLLVGMVELIFVDGFDNFTLSEAAEAVLFPS